MLSTKLFPEGAGHGLIGIFNGHMFCNCCEHVDSNHWSSVSSSSQRTSGPRLIRPLSNDFLRLSMLDFTGSPITVSGHGF